MSDLLSDNADVMNSLLRALSDPGQITPRAPHESLTSWQRRAVIEHAAPYIQAAERERTSRRLAALGDALRNAIVAADSDLRGYGGDPS